MPGVELSFDAGRFNPSVEQLVALRDAIADVFRPPSDDDDDDDGEDGTDDPAQKEETP